MTLIKIMLAAWYVMVPLFLCSLLLIAIILERIFFYSKLKVKPELFLNELYDYLDNKKQAEAQVFVKQQKHPLSDLANLAFNKKNSANLVDELGQAAAKWHKQLLRFDVTLSTIVKIAPLLGLLGTVTGMIQAFAVIAQTSGNVNQADLANYISEALVTTASGLIIAIPAIIFANFFAAKANQIIDGLNDLTVNLPKKL